MADEGFKRKLTAILSADVVGYSRLMGDNEDATIRTLTNYREVMGNLIQLHRGRLVDSTGDNLLAEFASAVDAVNCAVEIQKKLTERNADLPDGRKMQFRIGVNVGDVVKKEDRIYGDGVNIAARVEKVAKAGGICISGRVYDQVENKLELSYEFLGEQKVKNEWIPTGEDIKQVKLESLREAVDKYPCVILLGDPGCGKSTALENLAYQLSEKPDK
jgi:class 3 adenylate cyclase